MSQDNLFTSNPDAGKQGGLFLEGDRGTCNFCQFRPFLTVLSAVFSKKPANFLKNSEREGALWKN